MGGSATGYRVLGRMILGKEDDDGGGSDGIVDVDVGLIFFLCSVFLASLIMSAYAKIDVSRRPSFSLTLFFLGCLLTGYANAYDGTLAEVIELCQRAHPHVILYLLLPPLLFYSALTIEPNIFHKVTAQAVLLAGPGVLIVVMFIAPLCNLFNFGWSWTECFLLAAILSATDPVSVTSALKEMGAPEKLNMIIEGESLLNDGSAYVLFVIFKAMANPITGPDITAGEICITFLQLAFGGVLWGYVSGLFISFVLLFVKNLAVVQTSLMLCGVYTTFILAETTLGVSGVLAAVTYGIYMAGRGKLAVSQEVEESNQAVLKQVDFWCNAVVFLLAGVVVCDKIIDDAGILGSSIGNWLLLLLLYLSLNLVRALSLVILMPLLKRSGYGMTKGEAMIISNAGLRGAVGLALSLAVHDDTDIPYMHRNENNFFVAGIVCLTLLINGPSTKWLYIKLDLYPVHPFRAYTFQKAMLRLEQQEFAADESSIKSDWFHTQSDWELVRLLVPNFTDAKLVNGHVMLRPLNSVKSKFKSYTEQVRGGHAHPGGQSLLSSDFLLGDGDSAGAGEAADHLELEAIDSKRDNRALSDAGGLLDEDTVASRGITRRRRELNPEDELEGKEVKKSHEVEDSIRGMDSVPDTPSNIRGSITATMRNLFGEIEDSPESKYAAVVETLFNLIHANYNSQFKERNLSHFSMGPLLNAAHSGMEWGETNINDTSDLHLALKVEYERLLQMLKLPISARLRQNTTSSTSVFVRLPSRWILFNRLAIAFECLSGYVRAHQAVIDSHSSHKHLGAVFPQMRDFIRRAKELIFDIRAQFPVLFMVPATALTARALLFVKRQRIEKMHARGLIRERDMAVLVDRVDRVVAQLAEVMFNPLSGMSLLGT